MAMNKISKEEFLRRISEVHSAESITGRKYLNIHTDKERRICTGIRQATKKPFTIRLDRLFEAYYQLDEISIATLKEYVDRGQSPSLAILKKAGLA